MTWQTDNGRSPATANKLYRVITSIWRFARRRRLIDTLPDIERMPEEKHERQTWTPEDYAAILEEADNLTGMVDDVPAALFWRALILTIVNTAGRITAVMSIRVRDVDVRRREILLRALNQKQNADQRFELQPSVLAAILATDPEKRSFLFQWPYDKGNLSHEWHTLRRHYKRLLIDAGLPHDSKHLFHNLRAFTATMLADARGEEFARDYLGHSHVSVTRKYLDRAQMHTKRSGVAYLPEPEPSRLRVHSPEAS